MGQEGFGTAEKLGSLVSSRAWARLLWNVHGHRGELGKRPVLYGS